MSDSEKLTNILLNWYFENARDLPWRKTKDPYKIWLSEVILQQTTVRQGLPYYNSFVHHFPTVQHLAEADQDTVLKLWQGLGYYSRARNLLAAAKHICEKHKGHFPENYEDIIKLPGVGPYTAAAVLSFAFNKEYVVVDGNVNRVASRLFGIIDDIRSKESQQSIKGFLNQMIKHTEPEVFNQAIMEFGALQCVPNKPDCQLCPFMNSCYAYKNKLVSTLPLKTKKPAKRLRYFNYLILLDSSQNTIIRKREKKDIWRGLFEFPLIETQEIAESIKDLEISYDALPVSVSKSKTYKHILTHQKIIAQFFVLHTEKALEGLVEPGDILVPYSKLQDYAVPRLIDLYLNDLSITLF